MPFCYRGRQSGEARHAWWICVFGIFVVPSGWIHPWPSVSTLYSTGIGGTLYDLSFLISQNTCKCWLVYFKKFVLFCDIFYVFAFICFHARSDEYASLKLSLNCVICFTVNLKLIY